MDNVIDLQAHRRKREIASSIYWVGEQRVDPIDEELNRQFVEAQRRAMERVRDQTAELCKVLENIRDICREAKADEPSTTP